MIRTFVYSVASTVLSALLILAPIASKAEEQALNSGVKENLDVILLLDASGSMRRTDPLRLRDEGAKLIIQFLNAGDRLGIVEFSNFANSIRPMTNFEATQTAEISEEISKVGDSGIYTDLLQGIRMAQAMLEAAPRPDSDRVIILLSDGQMEPDPQVATANQQVAELNDKVLPQLRQGAVKVHTLALSELADRKLLAHISQQTEGLAVYAPSADQIHQSFQELFLAVKKPQVITMTSRGFPMDEGIKEATFYINHEQFEDPVAIKESIKVQTPSGEMISSIDGLTENIKWYTGSKFDVVTVMEPEVGTWRIEGLPSTESFATVMTNLRLVTEFPAATINSGDDVLLQARFYDSKKPVSLPELTGAVEYTYEIIPTDKISEPVQRDILRDDGKAGDRRAEDGIFSVKINIEEEGEYRLTVTAKAPTFVRQQQVPFKVKPRLVAIYVEEREIEQAPKAHSEDKKEEEKPAHGSEQSDTAEPETEEFFVVKLGEETGVIKEKTLRLLAIDSDQKRYNLPLTQSQEDKYLYQVRTSLLPHEGEFEMKATLIGQGKKRERITAESNRLLFSYAKDKNAPKVEVVEVVEHKEEESKETKKEPSAWPWAILITICNAGAGMFAVSLTKKSVAGISITAGGYNAPTEALDLIKTLEKLEAQTEVDLENKLFSETNVTKLRSRPPLDLTNLGSGIAGTSTQNEAAGVIPPVSEAVDKAANEEGQASGAEGETAAEEKEEVAVDQVATGESEAQAPAATEEAATEAEKEQEPSS